MKASARKYGGHFHRAWVAAERSALYAVACWETRAGATQFFTEWDIQDESGEVAIFLEGDIGLVPVPNSRFGGGRVDRVAVLIWQRLVLSVEIERDALRETALIHDRPRDRGAQGST
jgi:hypothetical protein